MEHSPLGSETWQTIKLIWYLFILTCIAAFFLFGMGSLVLRAL